MNLLPNTSTLAAPPRANPATPGGPAGTADDGPAFAQALDAAELQQRDGRPEGPADGEGATAPEAPEPAADPRERTRAAVVRGAGRPSAVGMPAAELAVRDANPVADDASSESAPEAAAATDEPPPEALAAWISALPLPRAPVTPPATTVAAGTLGRKEDANRAAPASLSAADATQAKGVADPRGMPAPTELARAAQAPTIDPTSTAAPPALQALARTQGRTSAAAEAPTAGGQEPPARALATLPAAAPAAEANPASLPALAAAWAAPSPAAPAPVTHNAELPPAVGSREFAPALAGQVSVMVRDGIEQARLTLNPAELGPIEVRIRIDGSQAQVDFSAAHATTRQALQEAVPALAGTLRENGLTLTGGGVFEQPRDPRGESRQDTPRNAPPFGDEARDDRGTVAGVPVRPARVRGMLDLYA